MSLDDTTVPPTMSRKAIVAMNSEFARQTADPLRTRAQIVEVQSADPGGVADPAPVVFDRLDPAAAFAAEHVRIVARTRMAQP